MRIFTITIIISFFIFNFAFSQQERYHHRVGLHSGVMTYHGDLNSKLFSPNDELRKFDLSYLTYGVSVETFFSSSWSAKFQYNNGQFIANDRAINWDGRRDLDNSNDARSLNAKTELQDFSLLLTFYSDNGKIFSKNAFLSPFIHFGMGVTHFNVYADLLNENGNRYYYWSDNSIRNQPQGTANAAIVEQDGNFETNVTKLQTEKDYDTNVLSIPFGGGLKFRLANRLNLNLDYTLRYTFTDYLDDVSGRYRDEYTSQMQEYAANPTNVVADNRGENSGNDWYGLASIALQYSFGKRAGSFVSPVIQSTSRYNQAIYRKKAEDIELVDALPIRDLSFLRDSLVTMTAPAKVRVIRQPIVIQGQRGAVTGATKSEQQDQNRMDQQRTLDSLNYLVRKQSLANQLHQLRMDSPDPAVSIPARKLGMQYAKESTSEGSTRQDSVAQNRTDGAQLNTKTKQVEKSNPKLQPLVQDTTRVAPAIEEQPIPEDSVVVNTADSVNIRQGKPELDSAAIRRIREQQIMDGSEGKREDMQRMKRNDGSVGGNEKAQNQTTDSRQENNTAIDQERQAAAAGNRQPLAKENEVDIAKDDPAVRLQAREDSTQVAKNYGADITIKQDSLDKKGKNNVKTDVSNRQVENSNPNIRPNVQHATKITASNTRPNRPGDSVKVNSADSINIKKENSQLDSAAQKRIEDEEIMTGAEKKRQDMLQKQENEERVKNTEKAQNQTSDSRQGSNTQTNQEQQTTAAADNRQPLAQDNNQDVATKKRILALEREIRSLKNNPQDRPAANNQPIIIKEGNDARVEALERELNLLRRRNRRNDQPTVVQVTPTIQEDTQAEEANEFEISKNQRQIDSLQQQLIVMQHAMKHADSLSRNNAKDTVAGSPEVENLKLEIESLRANVIAMSEDLALRQKDEKPAPPVMPEMPKVEVFFGVGSSDLSDSDKTRIKSLVDFIKKYPESKVNLRGYTDPTGSAEKNLALSKRRAESVKQVLIAAGITEDRIDTSFFGADRSVSQDLSYGRRVEIHFD